MEPASSSERVTVPLLKRNSSMFARTSLPSVSALVRLSTMLTPPATTETL